MPYNYQQNYQRNKSSWTPQSFDFNQRKYTQSPFKIQKANYVLPSAQEEEDRKKQLGIMKSPEKSGVDLQLDEWGLKPEDYAHMAKSGHTKRDGNTWSLDPNKKKETSWWDTIGDAMGGEGFLGGVKGWLDLGVRGIEAYTGLEQVDLAREQNVLGRDAFSFQKAAWNKDYDARKIAYNTNARDVNAWKAAQTPGGYVMSELVV
jgi:hypothetical protein